MKKSHSSLIPILLLLGLLCMCWIGVNSKKADTSKRFSDEESRIEREQTLTGIPKEGSEEWARRLSSPEWIPPVVFSRKGGPSPQIPFPRGEHASRRYHVPKTINIDPLADTRPPAILAKSPEDGRFHLLPDEIDLHTRFARRMVLDTTSLDSLVNGTTSQLLAPTVTDEVLTLKFKTVKTRDANTHTLTGHVVGEESTSDVQFVYHDGVLHGSIARYSRGQEIEYRILQDGHMMVREIDSSTMTAVCGNPNQNMEQTISNKLSQDGVQIIPQNDGEISQDTPGWRVIDVVVGYDSAARVADGGYTQIEARIIASVDLMTTAFANSLISNTELMLLGTIEDPAYVFPGGTAGSMGTGDELSNLDNFSNGALDTVSSYATRLGADMVSFVIKQTDGSAGIAYRPGRSSITARDYMTATRITFAHELGHNLGCEHSWGDSSQTYQSNYGWRLDVDGSATTTNDRVRTIMAYDWAWGAGARIPYFSNPNVNYNGAPTGAPNGHDVRTDTRGDQRYFQNGLEFSNGVYGFDGTQPALGANNAKRIDTGDSVTGNGATFASNRATRTAFNVISPTTGVQWERGTTKVISFNGGDMEDLATLKLYKGGVLQSTIASDLNPATARNYSWAVPVGLATGTDYMIRVELVRNGSTLTADSGIFSVVNLTPRVIAQTPASSPALNSAVSQIVLTFNNAINPATFAVADDVVSFTGPGAVNLKPAISGAVWSSGNTVITLNFTSQISEGAYQLILGSQIQDTNNQFLNQDMDGTTGEAVEDRYTVDFSILTLAGALDTSGLVWSTSGNATWFPQTVTTRDGTDAAQSGDIADSQISSIQTTLTGPGTLTFWWKVSSETGWDYLEFYLNDVLQTGSVAKISGNVDWIQKTVSIPSGSQTVRWTYRKDNSASTGSDAAWLDGVNYTPVPEIVVEQPVNTGLADGTATVNFGSVNTGSSSTPLTFTIRNTGAGNLTGLALSKTGTHSADYVLGSLGATSIAAGASTTFTVAFNPSAGGTRTAAIQIASNDSDENPFDISLTGTGVITPFYSWASQNGLSGGNGTPDADPDGDGTKNIMEFAFGTNPNAAASGVLEFVPNGTVTKTGMPLPRPYTPVPGNPPFQAVFGQRKDRVAAGLTYHVEFSANLNYWHPDSTGIAVISNDPASPIEVVAVPFPANVPLNLGGPQAPPKFFRIGVSGD